VCLVRFLKTGDGSWDWPRVLCACLIHCRVKSYSLQSKDELTLACGQYNPQSKSSSYKGSRKTLRTLHSLFGIHRTYSPSRNCRQWWYIRAKQTVSCGIILSSDGRRQFGSQVLRLRELLLWKRNSFPDDRHIEWLRNVGLLLRIDAVHHPRAIYHF
jgi:hypothetical protein